MLGVSGAARCYLQDFWSESGIDIVMVFLCNYIKKEDIGIEILNTSEILTETGILR